MRAIVANVQSASYSGVSSRFQAREACKGRRSTEQIVTDPIVSEGRNHWPSTSMSLLQQALADDHEAWQRIVFLYSPLVEAWCRRRHLHEVEIEEVGQKVFTKLLEKLGKFRKDEPSHSFRKWLKTLTGHEVDDYLREKYRNAAGQGGSANQDFLEGLAEDLPSTEPGTDDEEESERVGVLRRCLELVRTEFEPRTFEAFLLVVVDEKSPADVAEVLGMSSTGAVHTAKSRVTRRLRELLEQLEEKIDGM